VARPSLWLGEADVTVNMHTFVQLSMCSVYMGTLVFVNTIAPL
jgi:hypothetical protein